MKTTVNFCGKEVEITLTYEQLKAIEKQLTPPTKTGYERAKIGNDYYYISEDDETILDTDTRYSSDNDIYEVANYYSDPAVAENNARADKLLRQLRRFAVEHRENAIDWKDRDCRVYSIYYDYLNDRIMTDSLFTLRDFGQIYFDKKETAELAIETFKDELTWYFNEYRDSAIGEE